MTIKLAFAERDRRTPGQPQSLAMEALELRVQQTEERIVFLQRENERLTNSEEDLLNQLCISDQQQNQHEV